MSGNTCQGATTSCLRGGNVKFLWSTYLEREQAAKERQKAVEDQEMAAEERNEMPRSENKLSRNGKG
ncbi:hypothetical protein Tco_1454285 [Tanacetum coccineum]